MSPRKRVGILISGRGSNMASLIEASKAPDYPAEIAVVISNRPDAPGLAKAAEAGIATQTVDHTAYQSRQAFEQVLDDALREAGAELICNAGFMRLLTEYFVDRWRDRQLNIHPSLLPAFKGLDTHSRVLEAGAMITGCTVHFVRLETDSGPHSTKTSRTGRCAGSTPARYTPSRFLTSKRGAINTRFSAGTWSRATWWPSTPG